MTQTPSLARRPRSGSTSARRASKRAVDQVAGHHDQVDAERIGPLDQRLRPRLGKQATDVKVGQLQKLVAVELRRQPGDGDLDILERRHPRRLIHAQRRQQHGRARGCVAHAVRYGPAASKQQRHQPGKIERDLHQRQQQDCSERPVEQKHQGAGKLGRKDRAGREAAPEVVLRRDEQEDGKGDLRAGCPRKRPDKPRQDIEARQCEYEVEHGRPWIEEAQERNGRPA